MSEILQELRLSAFSHANQAIDEGVTKEDSEWHSREADKFRAAADEIDRLRSLLEETTRALEPFAAWADQIDREHPNGTSDGGFLCIGNTAKVRELRRAREAFLKAKTEK